MKKVFLLVIVLVVLIGGTFGGLVALNKLEWEKPTLKILPDSNFLGQKLSILVEDQKSGVSEIRVDVNQGGKTATLLTESFPAKTHRVEKTIAMRPLPGGLKDGGVVVTVTAKDFSWIGGNPVTLTRNMTIDTIPPQLTVLGALHYVNRGGAGVITYQVSEESPVNGVQMGEVFYPGYHLEKDHYVAYYPIPYAPDAQVSPVVVAEDRAGNRTKNAFRAILKEKKFRKEKIQLSDGFLNNVIPYFTAQNPNLKGNPIEIFLEVNRKQRELDHQQIRKVCQGTSPKPLWSGTFLRLPNAKPMASFAEDRSYLYNGQEVDRQTHLGVDLASLAQSPVPAANAGKIVFAGPLGIYGSTVVIDHGCGLFSLYAHMSKIDVEVNKEVKTGDSLGRTGSTGMAGGDHLHYAMMIQGSFINPIEWWDDHWIKDNVKKKMDSF